MSVDKFGRFNPYPYRSIHGSVCRSIDLTDDGDIDFRYKRLCSVADAILEDDAVNLNTLQQNCLCQIDDIHYDAIGKKITNLAQPKLPADVATKSYVDEKLPVITDEICNFNGHRLTNIGYPETSTDAVNKEFLLNEIENKIFQKTNYEVNFETLRLANVATPLDMTDAVNKQYLFERLSLFRDDMYRILYTIYKKTTNDRPIKNQDVWMKEYL